MAETSYAKCGDLSLAYQVIGDGPVELVVVGPFVSHIELAWTRRSGNGPVYMSNPRYWILEAPEPEPQEADENPVIAATADP